MNLFFAPKGCDYSREGDYFIISFTGSRVLNILFYFPIKSKNNRVKKTKRGLFKCSKFASLINFYCQYPCPHHWWLISFAGSDSTSASPSRFTAMYIDIGLLIVVGGGWAVMQGRRLIEGRLILEEYGNLLLIRVVLACSRRSDSTARRYIGSELNCTVSCSQATPMRFMSVASWPHQSINQANKHVHPHMGYIGTCRGTGYGFWGSRSFNRVSFLTLLFLCPWCGP